MFAYLRFKNWSIFFKLTLLALLSVGLVLAGNIYYFLPMVKQELVKDKQSTVRNVVQLATGILENYENMSKEGLISNREAKERAKDELKQLRYNEGDYLWINDRTPRMIMHPTNPGLLGKDLSDYKDPDGKRIFVEAVSLVEKSGSGYIDYRWPRPGTKKPIPKISYVQEFEPWGWIIGTGIYVEDIDEQIASFNQKVLWGLGVISIGILFLSLLISRTITVPINRAIRVAEGLSEGDLTVKIKSDRRDETGKLLQGMQAVTQKVSSIVDAIIPLAIQINDIVYSLRDSSTKTTDESRAQTSRSEEMATSAEEMTQTISEVAKNAGNSSETSSAAMNEAKEGRTLSRQAATAIDRMQKSSAELNRLISGLSENMSSIGDVVTLIKSIADQTNLLALNAAIEAARAGGKGTRFAVVSDEVRKLAEKTIKATEDISGIISSIQDETEKTAETMEITNEDVKSTAEKITGIADTMDHVFDAFSRVQEQIQHIASATEEQSVTSKQLAMSVEQSLDNAKSIENQAREVSNSVLKLTDVADNLRSSTMGIKTKGTRAMVIDLSKTDHRIWVEKVQEHLHRGDVLEQDQLTDHFGCRFGKWYYGEGKNIAGHLPVFKKMEEDHAAIHRLGRESVKLKDDGKEEEAENKYEEMFAYSQSMMEMLDELQISYQQILRERKEI